MATRSGSMPCTCWLTPPAALQATESLLEQVSRDQKEAEQVKQVVSREEQEVKVKAAETQVGEVVPCAARQHLGLLQGLSKAAVAWCWEERGFATSCLPGEQRLLLLLSWLQSWPRQSCPPPKL